MSTNRDERSSVGDARDNRRWFIGVGISLVFGLFSMVMALLSYSAGTRPTTPPAAKTPAERSAAEPAERGKARGGRRGNSSR